ncbi:MAG: hypothetical protein K2H20_01790 [Bacilli bacterium]|nr:hypothetical protein [Bacilli bacterium]
MDYKSYDEIMSYLCSCVVRKEEITKRLDEIGFRLFNDEKRELRSQLKELKREFKYYNNFILSATRFDVDLLTCFLVDYLSKNTDTRYLACKAERSESCGRTYSYTKYRFVCSATDAMILQINGVNLDEYVSFSTIKDNLEDRYIKLNEDYYYSLLNCDGLNSGFENFPELLEAGKKLVDLKIAYPMMSDEERLSKVLGNTLSNGRLNWKTKTFNKKYPNGKRTMDMKLSEVFSSKR